MGCVPISFARSSSIPTNPAAYSRTANNAPQWNPAPNAAKHTLPSGGPSPQHSAAAINIDADDVFP